MTPSVLDLLLYFLRAVLGIVCLGLAQVGLIAVLRLAAISVVWKSRPARFMAKLLAIVCNAAVLFFFPVLLTYVLCGELPWNLIPPFFVCFLLVHAVRIAIGAIARTSAERAAKLALHAASLVSDPEQVTERRVNKLGIYEFSAFFAIFIVLMGLFQFGWISSSVYIVSCTLVAFILIPALQAIEVVIVQNRLLWEVNVADELRLWSIVAFAPVLAAPALYGLVVLLRMQARLPHDAFYYLEGGLFVFLVAGFLASLVQLYIGSSGFQQAQDTLRESKRNCLKQIGGLALIKDPQLQEAQRTSIAAKFTAELRKLVNEDAVLRYVFAAYLFGVVSEDPQVTDEVVTRIATDIFDLDESETADHDRFWTEARARIIHYNSDLLKDNVFDFNTPNGRLMMNVLVPILRATGPMADAIRTTSDKYLQHMRTWDLRFWYGFDLIDYVAVLVRRDLDLSSFATLRAPDIEIINRPQYLGKAMLTAAYGVIAYLVGQFGVGKTLASFFKDAFS